MMRRKQRKPLWRSMGRNRWYGPVETFGRHGWGMPTYCPWKSFGEFGPFHRMMLRRAESQALVATSALAEEREGRMNDSATFYMYQANLGRPVRVFDWDKAASMIAERKPERAMAGLAEDFEYTRGTIYKDGKPVDKKDDGTYTILASTWATPILVIDGEEVECWKMGSETNGWDKYTCWPESALRIVGAV